MVKLILLFTIVYASQLYGMEEPNFFFNCIENFVTIGRHTYSYIYSFFGTTFKSSERVEALRKDLDWTLWKLPNTVDSILSDGLRTGNLQMLLNGLDDDPILFLSLLLENKKDIIQKILSDLALGNSPLLKKLQDAQINGYSAIGIAMVSELYRYSSIEDTRNTIKKLMNAGFTLTEKDKTVAEFELYRAIPATEKTKMILFLQQEDLLPEIKKNIINCMIESYREKYWLLPDNQ